MEWIIGLLIGTLIGATGVGGGTITAPTLILIVGFEPRVAVGTALVFSALVKTGAVILYTTNRNVQLGVLGWMLCGGLPASSGDPS